MYCPNCRKPVKEGYTFCGSCGQPLMSHTDMNAEKEWHLNPYEIARRIAIRDLPGFLKKTLEVEQGTTALILADGRHDGTLEPGTYPFSAVASTFSSLPGAKNAAAIVVTTRDIPLGFKLDQIATKDPLLISIDLNLSVGIDKPLLFLQNIMGNTTSYPTGHLANTLKQEIADVVKSFVRTRSINEIDQDISVKSQLEHEISLHLNKTLSRDGLRLIQVKTLNYCHQAWDAITKTRADYFLQLSEREAKLEGKKRLSDVYGREQLQEIAENTAQAEYLEKKAGIWDRLRQAIVTDKTSQIRNERELEDLIREVDKDRLIKDAEIEDLKRSIDFDLTDKEHYRDHLAGKMEIERRYELKKLDLSHRHDMSIADKTFELNLARKEFEWKLEQDLREHELEIRKRKMIADQELEEDAADIELAQRVRRQDKESKLDLKRIEDEIVLERMKSEQEIRLEEEREKHKMELERIREISKIENIDTLIAISGPDQARILAELARTETLSGCTPQQILAMQTEKNPKLAEGLAEIFKALSATGEFEQAERLLQEVKESHRLQREDYQRNMQMLVEMFNKAMDSIRDTAIAFSGSSIADEPIQRNSAEKESHQEPEE